MDSIESQDAQIAGSHGAQRASWAGGQTMRPAMTDEQKALAHRAVEVGGRRARSELCRLRRQCRRLQAAGQAAGVAVWIGDVCQTPASDHLLAVPVQVGTVNAVLEVYYHTVTARIESCATSARTAPVFLRRIVALDAHMRRLKAWLAEQKAN